MDKVTVMKDIDELHDTYCSDCLVIKQLRKERGKPGLIVSALKPVQLEKSYSS